MQVGRLASIAVAGALVAAVGGCSRRAVVAPERPTSVAPFHAHDTSAVAPDTVSGPPARDPETPLALGDAIATALRDNPELRAGFAAYEAKLQRTPQVTSLPDPTLMVDTHAGGGVQTRTGEQEIRLGVEQMIPWFGKRDAMGDMADADAQAEFAAFRERLVGIAYEVAVAYNDLAFERAALDLTREEQALMQQFLAAASAAYASGSRGRQAVLKAQTELARIDGELAGFPARIRELEARLARLMGLSAGTPPGRPALLAPPASALPGRAALGAALATHPEIVRMEAVLARAGYSGRLAALDYYPDLSVGANYIVVGDRPDLGAGDAHPEDEGEDVAMIALGLNIPIPNARRAAARWQARLEAEEAVARREATWLRLSAGLDATLARLESLAAQVAIQHDTLLPLAAETFSASNAEYAGGSGSFLDLLDAQRTLVATRRNILATQRDLLNARAELEKIVARRLPDDAKEEHHDPAP